MLAGWMAAGLRKCTASPFSFGARLRVLGLAGIAGLWGMAGCKTVSERELADSEGRRFLASCERAGDCTLSQIAGSKRTDEKTGLTLTRTGRLVGICDVLPGHGPDSPADCRPLV